MISRNDRIPSVNGNGGRRHPKLDRQVSTTSSRIRGMEHWIECRFILTALFFLGMMHQYMMRANLSVAMVVMVDNRQMMNSKNRTIPDCGQGQSVAVATDIVTNITVAPDQGDTSEKAPTFQWDAATRGWILAAFFNGYWTTQIIGGFLEHRFGGKLVFGGSVFLSSLLTLVTPTMAKLGPGPLIATRVLLGVCQGPMYPSHHGMWGKWAPPLARSRLISIAMTGTNIGTALSYNLSAYLSRHGFAGGWPSVFYVIGASGLVWSIFWAIFAYDTPAKHPRISERERRYIEDSIGTSHTNRNKLDIPWRGIFTSPIFWGLFLGHFCSNYGNYNLLTNLPSYIDQVFGLDLKTSSAVAGIPFISVWFFTSVAGWITDTIREKQLMSTIAIRRILIVIAQFLPAIFLIAAGYLGCDPFGAIAMVSLAASFGGFGVPGFKVCHIEIAPRYSGILYSFTNTFATFSGQVAPIVAGYLTQRIADPREAWKVAFYVGAGISAIGGVIVLATLKTEVQDWAKMDDDYYETEETKKKRQPSIATTENDDSGDGFFKTGPV